MTLLTWEIHSEADTSFWHLAGKSVRTPGLYKRADPDTGMPTNIPMTHTNERVHYCVRVRLELEGLGLNDVGYYKCTALTTHGHGPWRLRQMKLKVKDPIPWDASWGPTTPAASAPFGDVRWVWEYDGPEEDAPRDRLLIEESLGPFQRKLLSYSKGKEIFHFHVQVMIWVAMI